MGNTMKAFVMRKICGARCVGEAAESDRFHLVSNVIDRVPKLGTVAACAKQAIRDMWIEHRQYIREHGEDLPEVRNWRWDAKAGRQDAGL
jgi:hypothetical protein